MSNRKIIIFFLLIFSSIKCFSATFVVTNNADSGSGCLRDAITQATLVGGGTITFNLPNTVAGRTITCLSALPALPSNLIIDATTQAGTNFGVSNAKVAIFCQAAVEQNFAGFSMSNQSNITISGLYIKNITNVSNASKNYFWRGIKIEGGSNITITDNVITGFYFPLSDNWEAFNVSTNGLILQDNILGVDDDGITLPANAQLYTVLENLDGNITLGVPGAGNYFATGLSITGNNTSTSTGNVSITISSNHIGVDYATNTVSESFGLSVQNISTTVTPYISDNMIDNQSGVAAVYLNGLSKAMVLIRNYIGIDKTLTKNLSTSRRGIYVDGCPDAQIQIGDGAPTDANYITGCKPVEINNNSHVSISANSFFCTIGAYPMYDYTDTNIPQVAILTINNSSVSGSATPNSNVELFYSDKCNTCSPQTLFGKVTCNGSGQWSFPGVPPANYIASATLNGYTSEFSHIKIDSSNVKVTNACSSTDNGTITGMVPNSAGNIKWVNKNGVIAGTTANLTAPPGIYQLIVGNGSCEAISAFYTIGIHFEMDVSKVSTSNSTCGNNTGTVTGIIAHVSDTSLPVYTWKDQNGKSYGQTPTPQLLLVPAGDYTLTVTSGDKQCTHDYGPFTVKNTDGPVIDETTEQIQPSKCSGATGSVTNIKVTGGTGNYTYIWWNELQQNVATTKDLTGQPAGAYKLQVTDGSQCGPVYSSTIAIAAINGITLNETLASTSPATCEMSNGSITGILAPGATLFTWTDAMGKTYPTLTPDLTKASAGTYTLTASNNATGCSTKSKSYTITQPAAVSFPVYGFTAVRPCFKSNNGSITVTTDAMVKSARWTDVLGQPAGNGNTLANIADGTYQLYLTDQNGCEAAYQKYILSQYPEFAVTSTAQTTDDQCGLKNGGVSNTTFTGGDPPYNYQWFDSNQTLVGTANSISNLAAGAYTLNVTDARCGNVNIIYTINNVSENLQAPSVTNIQLCSSGNVIIKVNDADPKATYRLYNSPTATQPIDEQTGGQFITTVKGNSVFYISQVNGDCESNRAELKVTVGLSALNIANTFTPNGDGHNDYWQINNIENYPSAFVQVFNRYGLKVYESKGYAKPFDGNYGGKALPAGAYYYIINLSSNCNLLAGSLNIIR